MIKVLTIGCLIISMSTPKYACAEWQYIGDSTDGQTIFKSYINILKKNRGTVRLKIKKEVPNFTYMINDVDVNCNKSMYRILSQSYYTPSGLSPAKDFSPTKWVSIDSDETGKYSYIQSFVCK